MNSYRLSLIRLDPPETQVITVRSASESEARIQVLDRIGPGWRIGGVQLTKLP
jgi:hypothetical protein